MIPPLGPAAGTHRADPREREKVVVARLQSLGRALGGEQQECISLRFLQGLSVSETAAAMGKRDGAIKALQHRAVRRLAGMLPDGLR